MNPNAYELSETFDPDYEAYLHIILHGEPYDLDKCLWCLADVAECMCVEIGCCAICSAHAEIVEGGLCNECDTAVLRHLPKFELVLESRMAELGMV